MTGTQDQGSEQSGKDPVSALSDPKLKHPSARGGGGVVYDRHRSSGGGSFERVTVNLTSQSSQALELATSLTGDSKTDTINRAVQLYAYLREVISKGGSIYARESDDADPRELKFL
jgi:hypothetical protein